MKRIIDLTHEFTGDMPVYPGDPVPVVRQNATLEPDGFNEAVLTSGMHVGTHIDAPLHMIAGGRTISDVPVEQFIGRGVLVDARGLGTVTVDLLNGVKLLPGDIVVVLTGWSAKFRDDDYFLAFPEIDLPFAQRLVEAKASILALDTPSPDRSPFDIHKILLGNGVLIIENVTDGEKLLGAGSFEIIALPAKFDWDGAPVRVVACL